MKKKNPNQLDEPKKKKPRSKLPPIPDAYETFLDQYLDRLTEEDAETVKDLMRETPNRQPKKTTKGQKPVLNESLLDRYLELIADEQAAFIEKLGQSIKAVMKAHGFDSLEAFQEAGYHLKDILPGEKAPTIHQILKKALLGKKKNEARQRLKGFDSMAGLQSMTPRPEDLLKNSQVPSIPIMNSRFSKLLRTDPALLSGDLVPIKRKGGKPVSKSNPVILNARFVPPKSVVYTPRLNLTDAIGEMCFAAAWERKREKTAWTIDQICRMTKGQQDKQKITQTERREAIAMCERLRRTTAYIETPGGLVQESLCRVYLIAIYRDGAEETTENIIGYKLAAIPFVYNYDKYISNQVLSITPDLLEILEPLPDGGFSAISNTQNRTLVKWYLLLHLLSIKSGRLSSNVIRFDSLLQQLELEKAGRQTKSNVKEFTFKCLDYWTRKDFIGGYSRLKRGCGYYAVEISLESRHIDIKPKAQIAKKGNNRNT